MKATAMTKSRTSESGFSLIELMIAMTVTLIVSGAIYGLISGAKNAFRREPELSDRQQNTRIGMSMIEQDIAAAGIGLPAFTQAFAPGLDNVGPNGEDSLEIIVGIPNCPQTQVCVRQADLATAMVVETSLALPACAATSALGAAVFPAPGNQVLVGPLVNLGPTGAACGAGNPFGEAMTIQHQGTPVSWHLFGALGAPAGTPSFVVPVQVVRYTIATDPNDPLYPNDPNFRHLWRSATGTRSAADGWAADDANPPGATWQLVARGINDMQVTYLDGTGAVLDQPNVFVNNTQWTFIVRQVTVTLSSRVAAANIAGFTGNDMNDPNSIRLGQLVTQVAPRAGLLALQQADQWN